MKYIKPYNQQHVKVVAGCNHQKQKSFIRVARIYFFWLYLNLKHTQTYTHLNKLTPVTFLKNRNIVLMMINRILRSLYGKTKKKLEEMKIKDNDDLNMMMRYDDAGK
mgnify:CR=1 FL=1